MPYGSVLADVITSSNGVNSAGLYGFKNRIINGAMVIDQRNAGAAITPVNGQYTVDRFQFNGTQASKFTCGQGSGGSPAGFSNYLAFTSASAYAVGASDSFSIQQKIEGYNIADLGWGTADAKTVTLSFQVYSSLTGTFGGSIANNGGSRTYPFSYSIPAANTWTTISVTIAGDTTGTWLTTNGVGLSVRFGLGSGSTFTGTAGAWATANFVSATGATSVVGVSGATFYITGVQLEKGSTATSFDYLDYGRSLMQCQRYYFKYISSSVAAAFGSGYASSTTVARVLTQFPVPMRDVPSALEQSGTAANYELVYLTASTACNSVPVFTAASTFNAYTQFSVASGLTAGNSLFGRNASTNGYLAWSVEL
jgi:hypothetical protein